MNFHNLNVEISQVKKEKRKKKNRTRSCAVRCRKKKKKVQFVGADRDQLRIWGPGRAPGNAALPCTLPAHLHWARTFGWCQKPVTLSLSVTVCISTTLALHHVLARPWQLDAYNNKWPNSTIVFYPTVPLPASWSSHLFAYASVRWIFPFLDQE